MAAYCNMHVRHNSVRDIVFGREPVPESINIATLCPEEKDPRVERMTRSAEVLRAAAIGSAKRTLRAFGRRVDDFVEVLRPYVSFQRDQEKAISESDDSTLSVV
jgi:hypothetical protein